MLEAATVNPVFGLQAGRDRPEEIALACAKSLALDDTVVFGRVLLTQANQRSAVMQADAALASPTKPNGSLA